MPSSAAARLAADIQRIVPGGITPPEDIPADLFEAALAQFEAGERIDMTALAERTGTTRMTVWRKAGNRDNLIGEVLWFAARRLYARALIDTGATDGTDRIAEVSRRFTGLVHALPPFKAFLDVERDRALALLTSRRTRLQRSIVEMAANLIELEAERGTVRLTMPAEELAYALVRIGESFLYADLIAGVEPDLDRATQITTRILEPERA